MIYKMHSLEAGEILRTLQHTANSVYFPETLYSFSSPCQTNVGPDLFTANYATHSNEKQFHEYVQGDWFGF